MSPMYSDAAASVKSYAILIIGVNAGPEADIVHKPTNDDALSVPQPAFLSRDDACPTTVLQSGLTLASTFSVVSLQCHL